jgi:hypothetical protein
MADDVVASLVAARSEARLRREFALADAIRRDLLGMGVVVFDASENGQTSAWRRLPQGAGSSGGGCMSWSHRRQAFCPEPRCDAEWFCRAHCETLAGRIPCPIDPRHNCKAAALASHLERCQQAPGRPALLSVTAAAPAWVEAGINHGPEGAAEAEDGAEAAAVLVASKDAAVLDALQLKVEAALGALGALAPLPSVDVQHNVEGDEEEEVAAVEPEKPLRQKRFSSWPEERRCEARSIA